MRVNPDVLFADDGSVRLSKLTGLAITMARSSARKCLSRQPTQQRAEAVADAVRAMCRERGHDVEVRPGRVSFGVYLAPLPPN